MLKVFITLVIMLLALSLYIVKPILAGGDQVRGDKGVGSVVQTCVTVDGTYTCMWE